MMTPRRFNRYPAIALLLLLTIALVTPVGAAAKVYIVNGQDGAEGDPGDGLDFVGGGGHTGISEEELSSDRRITQIIVYPTMYGCLRSLIIVLPSGVFNYPIEVIETEICQEEVGGLP